MDDDCSKTDLFRWKRKTSKSSSRVYSRSQNCKTDDDIQNWMKRVEQASDRATEVVLGTSHTAGRERGKYAALQSQQQVREHDEIMTEAQELLNNWVQEKLHLDDEGSYDDVAWHRTPVQAEVKREWDHLLGNNDWEVDVTPRTKVTIHDRDPYADLCYSDEEGAVETILSNMMQKKVVQDDFLHDLRLDGEKHKKDPRIKMELRHKQVKENREKREKELEKKRRAKQEKKDSLHKAKQIVIKEEREKDMEKKREEQEIKKQMAHIRKEMQDDRRKQEEAWQREMREREERDRDAREELARRTEEQRRQEKMVHQSDEEKRRRRYEKMERFQVKQSAKNLKCLQRHFSAWYQRILERRLQMGKARALSDWKMLLRAWNSWRSYVRSQRINVETKLFEQSVVDTYRKQQQADVHYRSLLLRRYLSAWQSYVRDVHDRRHLESEQQTTRSKMLALLDAAATGKLWKGEDGQKKGPRDRKEGEEDESSVLDDFFQSPHPGKHGNKSKQNGRLSSRSETSLASTSRVRPDNHIPREAWQVTREHVKLTNDEIASLGGGDSETNSQHSDVKVRRRFGKQPWMNTHYVINNFENRFTAQQKMLRDQQSQIKEQQRMIEELKFLQTQQQHQENIARQQLIQQQLAKHGLSPLDDESSKEGESDSAGTSNEAQTLSKEKKTVNILSSRGGETGNKLSKTKDTNLALETSRTQLSSRSDIQTGRTASSVTSGASSNNKYVQVLKNMEDRAQERKKQKEEREAKRKKAEEERLALLEAQEEEIKREMEEERKTKALAYKEKKRLEKQKESEKYAQLERLRELTAIADAHYKRSLMKYRGLRPLQKLVEIKRTNEEKAVQHHSHCITRQVVQAWHHHVAAVVMEKNKVADEMNSFLAVKRCFNRWRLYKHHLRIELEKGRRHHEKTLLSKILQCWADVASEEKFARWERERDAKEHYLWYLKKKTFCAWRRLPEEVKATAEREKRRNEMRKKVAHLLPDFQGIVNTSTELI